MARNPYTLQEETEEERKERQRLTGEMGNGTHVLCTPDPSEPSVTEMKHRAVCLMRPYAACHGCRHGVFTLTFKSNPERYQMVRCPMWKSPAARLAGQPPDEYRDRELATCEDKPFDFCASCPGPEELMKLSIDKTKEGWYSRWRRFRKEMEKQDGDD